MENELHVLQINNMSLSVFSSDDRLLVNTEWAYTVRLPLPCLLPHQKVIVKIIPFGPALLPSHAGYSGAGLSQTWNCGGFWGVLELLSLEYVSINMG